MSGRIRSVSSFDGFDLTEDSESVPIYAASLLDPCSLEHGGSLNEEEVEKDSISVFGNNPSFLGQQTAQDETKAEDDFLQYVIPTIE